MTEQVVEKTKKTYTSRKDRPTHSLHVGDTDFPHGEITEEDIGDATWREVCTVCCVHTGEEWAWIGVGILAICFFLYFFLFALELLGTGAKVMTGCKAGELFGDDTNPIAGLMVGILATVLLQSSSTTTSIIVSLTGTAISVQQGIYMVMGANIGTSVTNTIVAIGQMGDGDQLERAFAGATVHDMFNFMSVAILLPLEAASGYLDKLTYAMVKNANTEREKSGRGQSRKLLPLLERRSSKPTRISSTQLPRVKDHVQMVVASTLSSVSLASPLMILAPKLVLLHVTRTPMIALPSSIVLPLLMMTRSPEVFASSLPFLCSLFVWVAWSPSCRRCSWECLLASSTRPPT